MKNALARREFLSRSLTAGVAAGVGFSLATLQMPQLFAGKMADPWFKISLAQWSLHRMHRADKLTNLDFPAFTKKEFGIEAVEYVNIFWQDKARDSAYLKQLKQRCSDAGVRSLLIMVDKEGNLGDPNEAERQDRRKSPAMGRSGQISGLPLDSRQRPLGRFSGRTSQARSRRPPAVERVC